MKISISAILGAIGLVAIASAANVSPDTIYKFKISAQGPLKRGLDGSILALKDESAGTTPSALGVWNSGNPRNPYTFTLGKSSLSDKLYEINGALKKTHLVLHGNRVALGVYDVAIGADPTTENLFTNQWWATDSSGPLQLFNAEAFKAGTPESPGWTGAGSWRLCYGNSTAAFPDYQLVWFDGLRNLTQYFGMCESAFNVQIVEHTKASSTSRFSTGVPVPTTTCTTNSKGNWIPGVPAPTNTEGSWIPGLPAPSNVKSSWIPGLPAPSTTVSKSTYVPGCPAPSTAKGTWITGVPSPSSNGTGISTATPTPAPFQGGASRVGFAGMLLSITLGLVALFL